MNKYLKHLSFICISSISFALISWGFKGHRAMATIAQKHLTSNTAYVVASYLKGQSMADVSTWADEHKNPTTGKWHFLNLPLGLNHQQFIDFVMQQSNDNVYAAIVTQEAILKDKTATADQKNSALTYLIHLVGDAHQPMHVSRKEDKGGNTIQVRFDDKGTNLHSLWDSKLIDHEGLSEAEIAKQYDWANPVQIKKWQADSPIEWLWESYQISNELYADIKPGQTIDEAYYKKYIQTIHLRIDQAGIRLAGELNRLFSGSKINEKVLITNLTLTPPSGAHYFGENVKAVNLKDITKHIGDTVKITDKIYSQKELANMTMINLGAAYPNQKLTLIFKGKAKEYLASFSKVNLRMDSTFKSLIDRQIIAIGAISQYNGRPQIIITDPNKFAVLPK